MPRLLPDCIWQLAPVDAGFVVANKAGPDAGRSPRQGSQQLVSWATDINIAQHAGSLKSSPVAIRARMRHSTNGRPVRPSAQAG